MTDIQFYLIDNYKNLAYTSNYIFGYSLGNVVYAAMIEDADDLLPFLTYVDRASSKNGGTYSLKYRQNMERIGILTTRALVVKMVCTLDELENEFKNSKLNRGQIFETKVQNIFGGQLTEKKNAKFTDCGDIVIAGIHYQIKYNKATFTDEKTLANLRK